MLVRNHQDQVRRHICSYYGAILRSPSVGLQLGLGAHQPNTFTNGLLRRDISSATRKKFFSTTSQLPKSSDPASPPESDSYQSSMERMFRRYMPKASSSGSFYRESKRAAPPAPGSFSGQRVKHYSGGAGAIAAVILVGAVAASSYEEGTPTRTQGMLLSTWSILWDSVVEFKDKISTLLRDGIDDVIEAGAATAVLARCLISVLLTVSEVWLSCQAPKQAPTIGISSWLKPGVAALLADVAAHESRRKAVVDAGGGRVVDWLLKAVGTVDSGASRRTQAEASRALAHLLSDENTCEAVLSRPHALPYLFQFASSPRAKQDYEDEGKGQSVQVDTGGSTGISMLVTAIMDLVTSSCDAEDGRGLRPKLPGNADPGDISAALLVVKDGGWPVDDRGHSEDASAGKASKDKDGVHGIGIRVLGGTGIVGIQRDVIQCSLAETFIQPLKPVWSWEDTMLGYAICTVGHTVHRQDWSAERTHSAYPKYGLWDDLQGRQITVPLAAWALATWADASIANCAKIVELDENGDALLAAILAPEKTVKWHGSMTMRLLFGMKSYAMSDVATRWCSPLLDAAAQAGRVKDFSLAHSALAALTDCVSRSKSAHSLMLQEALPVMREIAGESNDSMLVQGVLTQVLDALTAGGSHLPLDESNKWAAILLRWVCDLKSDNVTQSYGSKVLDRVVSNLGQGGIPISQAWLAKLLMEVVSDGRVPTAKGKRPANAIAEAKMREQLQNQVIQAAIVAAAKLANVVAQEAAYRADISETEVEVAESAAELPMIDLLGLDVMGSSSKSATREVLPRVTATEAADAVRKAVKALTELTAEDQVWRQRILEAGVLCILRRLLLCNDYEMWAASEAAEVSIPPSQSEQSKNEGMQKKHPDGLAVKKSVGPQIRKHATRLLSVLSLQPAASAVIAKDLAWVAWLGNCVDGSIAGSNDRKTRSYALTSLINVSSAHLGMRNPRLPDANQIGKTRAKSGKDLISDFWPRFEDGIFIMNPGSDMWKTKTTVYDMGGNEEKMARGDQALRLLSHDSVNQSDSLGTRISECSGDVGTKEPAMDIVFIHGLRGGPFKTWRVADNKTSTTTPVVEKLDLDAGKKGTCWPEEWLSGDLPRSRLLSVKYKTNLSEWSGATLPLQEVSSMLLDKLIAAGVGERPLVFVTHSMGGLVVKQMLLQAGRDQTRAHLVNNTTGIVFYSCPHFGSKLADVPWRIGYVFRPAPSIGELRSGSPRLEELNRCLRQLHKEGRLDVLNFSETKVTPIVEGYGGWGLRMEVVPIESAYPGFGELVVLPGTDHVNSCKPLDRADPAYTKALQFLQTEELHAVAGSQQK